MPSVADSWHSKNRPHLTEYMRAYRRSPEARARRRLLEIRKLYGLTPEQYQGMMDEQDGKCAICGFVFITGSKKTEAHVDHCHTTGKVRGLLCSRCNTGLGMFQDNQEILDNAKQYLGRR